MLSKDETLAEFHQRYAIELQTYLQENATHQEDKESGATLATSQKEGLLAPTLPISANIFLGQLALASGISVVDLVHIHQIACGELGEEHREKQEEFLRLVLSAYERSQRLNTRQGQFNRLPDILYSINTEYYLQRWNPALEKVTGLSQTRLMNESVLSLFPLQEQPLIADHIQAAFRDGQHEIDTLLLTRAGPIPYRIKGMVMKNEEGEVVGQVGLGNSLTETTLNIEALRDSEERFRHLVENLNEVFWLMDIENQAVIYVSPSYEKVWGQSCESLYENPQSWLSVIHPQESDRIQATLPAQRHGPWEQEYRILHPSGVTRWVRTRCFPVRHPAGDRTYRLASISEDITERKQTQVALERSISLLQATLDSTADGILVLNREGNILNFNQQYVQMWRIPPKILSSRDSQLVNAFLLDQMRYPEDFINFINQDYQNPAEIHQNIIELIDDRIIELISRPYELSGQIRGRVHCFSDVTTQRKAAESLESLNEDLESRVNKRTAQLRHLNEQLQLSVQEKETLLKELHHRVKNNLQVIASLLRLQSSYVQNPQDRELFKDSENRVRSMSLIHEKLYRSQEMGEINAQDYLYTVVNNLISSYGISSQRIKMDFNLEPIALDVDTAIPCGLIVNELISNCFKYAFSEDSLGIIKVEFTSQENHTVHLVVADNGRGLPEGFDLEEIDSLGLQLVQNLVEQLEGNLTLIGNEGTQIAINFPWVNQQKEDHNDEFDKNISG
ncbi:PAS domain-containing sensor histidine kinase [Roseofilum capinflatum]|uniref:Histidine kinase dimerization/phosphoacceptor domain -containing protein n=1 Tax=Roseofilum capinflatum BLCC-M114 TaxID=3022440 RepID=A0ABT7B6Q5_9CYAN|nr:histidine kinase dimerization/phosphoacceptor domain -containing protein [Roseofilum capinflatum]MDJ1174852.1 histidine kinase dimerization/phosphoacceptor domain -containing protein [Roseofilum capinflatum BLCC-M114]